MVEGSGCEKENMIGYSSIHNNLKLCVENILLIII